MRKFWLVVCLLLGFQAISYTLRLGETLRQDFHWTHISLNDSLSALREVVEIHLPGAPLPEAVRDRQLAILKDGQWVPLQDSDLKVRVNNKWEVAYSQGLWAGALIGMAFVAFVALLISWLEGRPPEDKAEE